MAVHFFFDFFNWNSLVMNKLSRKKKVFIQQGVYTSDRLENGSYIFMVMKSCKGKQLKRMKIGPLVGICSLIGDCTLSSWCCLVRNYFFYQHAERWITTVTYNCAMEQRGDEVKTRTPLNAMSIAHWIALNEKKNWQAIIRNADEYSMCFETEKLFV